jgi:ElaB/YqjD/DUF883 family membrane-anchored ribosome-binding protein
MARAGMEAETTVEKVRESAAEVAARAGAAVDTVAEAGRMAADEAAEMAASVQERLKAVGVDTDVMLGAAKDQAGELQKLVADELRARPLRALGLAAAAGLIVGYLSAR